VSELPTTDRQLHTRGPWILKHVSGNNFAVQEWEIRSEGAYPIFSRSNLAIDGTTIHCSPQDARLIVAAPDMYEICKELMHWVHGKRSGRCLTDDIVQRMSFAIAKAEGRSNG